MQFRQFQQTAILKLQLRQFKTNSDLQFRQFKKQAISKMQFRQLKTYLNMQFRQLRKKNSNFEHAIEAI